jgi:hypothetical protein
MEPGESPQQKKTRRQCDDQFKIGERDSAIASYTRGEEIARGTSFKCAIELSFKSYKTQPYHTGRR